MITKAFLQGMADFFLGNKKEVSYSKTPDNLMYKAFKMTGDNLYKTMKIYKKISKKC